MPNLTPPNPIFAGMLIDEPWSMYRRGVKDAQRLMLEALEDCKKNATLDFPSGHVLMNSEDFIEGVFGIMDQLRTLREEPTNGTRG